MTKRGSRPKRAKFPDSQKHIAWFWPMLDSDAYRNLSGNAVKLMTRLQRRFNGSNNGRISMSVREAAQEVGCAINTARKCFAELEDARFVEVITKGAFAWKKRHASTWRLTWLHTNDIGSGAQISATMDFMRRPTMPGCRDEPVPDDRVRKNSVSPLATVGITT